MEKTIKLLHSGVRIFSRGYRTFDQFVPVFKRGFDYLDRRAIEDNLGEYTYGGLLKVSLKLSKQITSLLDEKKQERVGFMCSNDANFVIVKWALWMSGQIAVPLCCFHPTVALEYFLDDLDASLLIAAPEHAARAKDVAAKTKTLVHIIDCNLKKEALIKYLPSANSCDTPVIDPEDFKDLKETDLGQDDSFYKNKDAMIIYTSGSTGAPKGVIFTHANLHAQVQALAEAWKLSKRDCLLQIMPNHRGQSVVLGFDAPLSIGARIVLLNKFDPADVWLQLLGVRKRPETRVNMFISHPHMFLMLIRVYENVLKHSDRMIDHIRTTCLTKVRLMSCGCGPVTRYIYDTWEAYTGHQIQERLSMAETGIIMATPLHGTKTCGTVGLPLPGVHVRLTSEKGDALIAEGSQSGTRVLGVSQPVSGMLQVRTDGAFTGYWRKPTTTQDVMTRDGWFKTGDLVQYSRGVYKVLGRLTTDVIRSGNNYFSTQMVEAIMRDHPEIRDAAVINIKNLTRGEYEVYAVVKLTEQSQMSKDKLLSWLSDNLPKFAIPTKIQFIKKIPRTWQGKPDKDLVQALFNGDSKLEVPCEKNAATKQKN
ncbi:acyl-CoA synthetase family member 3, mitochondrial [Cimex lectularius]|uniref:Uncharacterized protein n=1 Tax=Cimex lectularius TaxID=79782 RepID=A0A8I6RM97_CIMLE|nr:acyl-CoA synthetase family member 3, mitochondrial [Cimex lectularius]